MKKVYIQLETHYNPTTLRHTSVPQQSPAAHRPTSPPHLVATEVRALPKPFLRRPSAVR